MMDRRMLSTMARTPSGREKLREANLQLRKSLEMIDTEYQANRAKVSSAIKAIAATLGEPL